MSEDSTFKPIAVKGSNGEEKRPRSNIRIVRVEPRKTDATNALSEDQAPIDTLDFPQRVASFTPVCDKIFGILDGAGVKVIEHYADGVCTGQQTEKLANAVRLSKESREVAAGCSARILARRVENPDTVDILGLFGVFAEWSGGVFVAIAELRKQANELRSLKNAGRIISSEIANEQAAGK